jgi:aspartate aminotransferase-like enzyme
VSALRLPPDRSATALVQRLADAGWLIAPGLDQDTDRLIRIGHLGEGTPHQLDGLLSALDRSLAS